MQNSWIQPRGETPRETSSANSSHKGEELKLPSPAPLPPLPIWNYFLSHVDGGEAKCLQCDRILYNKGGTTGSMKNYIKSVHKLEIVTKATYINSHIP